MEHEETGTDLRLRYTKCILGPANSINKQLRNSHLASPYKTLPSVLFAQEMISATSTAPVTDTPVELML